MATPVQTRTPQGPWEEQTSRTRSGRMLKGIQLLSGRSGRSARWRTARCSARRGGTVFNTSLLACRKAGNEGVEHTAKAGCRSRKRCSSSEVIFFRRRAMPVDACENMDEQGPRGHNHRCRRTSRARAQSRNSWLSIPMPMREEAILS